MPRPATEGLQYPRDGGHHHSTTRTAKAILGAALEAGHNDALDAAQQALAQEGNWRRRYPVHLHALSAAGAADSGFAVASAQAGLEEAWRQFQFLRGRQVMDLASAMQSPQQALHTHELRGSGGTSAPQPWALPYRGKLLQGNAARDVIARWLEQGIVEPGHAQALHKVLDNPDWFDLSDRHLVLLGAGSEAGPLSWLARWRANLVAVDLPGTAAWHKIATQVSQGNGRLLAPVADKPTGGANWQAQAGANLLTDTPEIAAWLAAMAPTLDIAALAYLDGERHVRVSLAMDAISHTVAGHKADTGRMFMATPTDIFVVPQAIAEAVMRRHAQRSRLKETALSPVRALSGGRWLRPHIGQLIHNAANGHDYGLVDALVVEQGPNYALAKRLQQWRALLARQQGQRVSFNVAPSTTTTSVVKNAALKAGFDGAHRFGIEVFAPETTNALMAAMWVHDLRNPDSVANPATPLEHPLEQFTRSANHGGLWRLGYLPRSALPLAAMMGFLAPSKKR
jgi:hypothetical protein